MTQISVSLKIIRRRWSGEEFYSSPECIQSDKTTDFKNIFPATRNYESCDNCEAISIIPLNIENRSTSTLLRLIYDLGYLDLQNIMQRLEDESTDLRYGRVVGVVANFQETREREIILSLERLERRGFCRVCVTNALTLFPIGMS